ncbi:O-antigen ligase [Herbiconiux sp. VKM Ac-2851]|uniref:O-antigen ligase family protein n=1 Tax=Herbiconiux sp. VKM Ac-2851 TaxID=2739025 RepID=UPI001566F258|nr:O-antigen ligase family protein [Herbiconiux sp. VKM Ac-2851]NQX35583.1 O-antigen ligase family protein [Herbiconiux sp. VKM Ac-2851]
MRSRGASGVITALVGAAALFLIVIAIGIEYTLIAAVVLFATAVLLRFPIAGIYALVVLLPFNGLVSQVTEGSFIPTLYGAAKDFILLGILLVALISGRVKQVPAPVVALVFITVVSAMASAIFTPDFLQASYGWRNDYEPLLLLIAVPAIADVGSVRRILALVLVMGQISAAVAVVTWTRGLEWLFDIGRLPVANPDDFPTSLFSSGSNWPRAFSPYVAPNEMAVVMASVLAVIWLFPRIRGSVRMLLSVLPVVAIILSGSRSALLGAVVLACVLAARSIYSRSSLLSVSFLVLAAIGVLAGAGLYITNQLGDGGDPSLGGHSSSLDEGLRTLVQNPFGVGLGLVGPRAANYEQSYHVESFWLLIGLEAGVIVLGLFVILMLVLVRRSVTSKSSLGFLGAAVLAASLVSQLVLPTFQEGAVSFLVWLLVGLSLTALRNEEAAELGTSALHEPVKELTGGSQP